MSKNMWHSLMAVLMGIMLVLSACGPARTEAPGPTEAPATEAPLTEAPTEAPATEAPATEAPATEAPTVPPTVPDLATEFSVFYALPDTGIAYLLTPRRESPGITAEELAKTPDSLENQVLGILKVVQPINDKLPADTYTLTLDPTGENVLFTGANSVVSFPAVIRTLPLPLPESRPVAMISSVQMCLAWDTLQICALVPIPLRSDLIEQLNNAIKELGSDPSLFALDRAIPDVEGDNVLEICLAELIKDQPDYAQCRASVLAAPALQALEPPPGAPGASSATVLVVLENLELKDDVFSDPQLTKLIGELPPANYLMYGIVLPDDPVIGEYDDRQITASRIGLSSAVGKDPELYMRAIIGAPFTGEAVRGTPPDGPEAVISNLWWKDWNGKWHCVFGTRQCPYYK